MINMRHFPPFDDELVCQTAKDSSWQYWGVPPTTTLTGKHMFRRCQQANWSQSAFHTVSFSHIIKSSNTPQGTSLIFPLCIFSLPAARALIIMPCLMVRSSGGVPGEEQRTEFRWGSPFEMNLSCRQGFFLFFFSFLWQSIKSNLAGREYSQSTLKKTFYRKKWRLKADTLFGRETKRNRTCSSSYIWLFYLLFTLQQIWSASFSSCLPPKARKHAYCDTISGF